jgi:hypothetical protein
MTAALQLAAPADIDTACAFLRVRGYDRTDLAPSLDGAYSYIIARATYAEGSSGTGTVAATSSSSGTVPAAAAPLQYVVPLSAKCGELSAGLMHRLVTDLCAAHAALYSSCTTEEQQQQQPPPFMSLAIVDGVDVVQVQLFAGVQPPSERYAD